MGDPAEVAEGRLPEAWGGHGVPMAKGKRSLSVERDPARVDKPEKERKMRRQLGCGAGDLIRSSGEVALVLRLVKTKPLRVNPDR